MQGKFNRLQISLSANSHLIADLYSTFVVGLIPLLVNKFGLTLFKVGLLNAVNMIPYITMPIFGYLTDRYELKYFMIYGLLFGSIFASLIGIMPNYCLVLLILFLGSISIAAFHPPSAAISVYFSGNRRGLCNAIFYFGGIIGNSLGPLFIIFIVEKLGMKFTPLSVIPGIIMSIILVRFIPKSIINNRIGISVNSNRGSKSNFFSKLKKINKIKLILLINIIFAFHSCSLLWLTLFSFMPLYFTNLGISLINIGYILLMFGLFGGIGGLFFGYLSDKFRRSFILQLDILLSITLVFFVFKTSGILSITLFVFAGFFLLSISSICLSLSQDIFPNNIGLVSSLVMGIGGGSAGITMIFLGKIADYVGIIRTTNYTLILLTVVFFILMLFPILEKKNNYENSTEKF